MSSQCLPRSRPWTTDHDQDFRGLGTGMGKQSPKRASSLLGSLSVLLMVTRRTPQACAVMCSTSLSLWATFLTKINSLDRAHDLVGLS